MTFHQKVFEILRINILFNTVAAKYHGFHALIRKIVQLSPIFFYDKAHIA
ncbi:hypothetical protein NSMM_260027 [Nitrosomonas mobilis]|uniref:Uncharacterized protein n=1 Tax=Nitrosomonas mobilis TaxID=51642 RepID=A0A1G5SDW2_9PROT|nr:hypothetical protein NSMM_260027 [Nitrosomonas mobilis]